MSLSLLLAAAATTPSCALADPAGCSSAAEVLAAPGATDQLRALTRGRSANYLSDGLPSVDAQLIEVLRGRPEKVRKLAGARLFGACRLQSCGERAAMIVTDDGKVVATAILHGSCGVDLSRPGCARDLSLSIWGGEDIGTWRIVLADWAGDTIDSGEVPVHVNGEGEPVVSLTGEVDGDRQQDVAALVSDGDAYRLVVRRGADPDHPATIARVTRPEGFRLSAVPGGLAYGAAGQPLRTVRWNGKSFAAPS